MRRIVLLGCTNEKHEVPMAAYRLYSKSKRFRVSWDYVRLLVEDVWSEVFILSAKHGLLRPQDWVRPYDATLVDRVHHNRDWADQVAAELVARHGTEPLELYMIAGRPYRMSLVESLDRMAPRWKIVAPMRHVKSANVQRLWMEREIRRLLKKRKRRK